MGSHGSFSRAVTYINFLFLNFCVCRNTGLAGKDDDPVAFFSFDDDWYGFLLSYALKLLSEKL